MSIFYTIDPRQMTSAKSWCDAMSLSLINVGQLPHIRDDTEWKAWATGVIAALGATVTQLPSPDSFEDWKDWAFEFNKALNAG